MITREIEMYVFSKPMDNREDLCQWESHFHDNDINCWIYKRADGKYQLEVDAAEVRSLAKNQDPVPGPCKFCGEWGKLETKNFIPLHFCCEAHMNIYRSQMAKKYWGKTWDELVMEGIAPEGT